MSMNDARRSAEWQPGSVGPAAVQLSSSEQLFLNAWRLYGIEDSDPEPHYKTDEIRSAKSNRVYEWDFAWPRLRLLIEIHGFSRHNSIAGLAADAAKMRAALAAGWMVVPITSKCLGSIAAREDLCSELEQIINQRWAVTAA